MQPPQAQPRNSIRVLDGFADALGYHFTSRSELYSLGTLLNIATVFPESIGLRTVGIVRLCIFGGCLALHLRYRMPLHPRFYAFLATHIERGMTEVYGNETIAKFWLNMDMLHLALRLGYTLARANSLDMDRRV